MLLSLSGVPITSCVLAACLTLCRASRDHSYCFQWSPSACFAFRVAQGKVVHLADERDIKGEGKPDWRRGNASILGIRLWPQWGGTAWVWKQSILSSTQVGEDWGSHGRCRKPARGLLLETHWGCLAAKPVWVSWSHWAGHWSARSAFLDGKASSRGQGAEELQTTAKSAFFIQVQSPAAGVPVHGVCHRPTPAMPSSDMQEQNHGCTGEWAAAAQWWLAKHLSSSQQFWGTIYNWRAPGVFQTCGSPPIRAKRFHLLTTGLF